MASLGETIQKLQAELQQAQEQIERLTSQLQVCREAANDSEMRWQG
jgi:prefoldin subunit 5